MTTARGSAAKWSRSSWFLIGYALGVLVMGLAWRFAG